MSATFWTATCTASTPIITGEQAWVVLGLLLVVGVWAWMAQAAFIVICGHDESPVLLLDERAEAVAWVAP